MCLEQIKIWINKNVIWSNVRVCANSKLARITAGLPLLAQLFLWSKNAQNDFFNQSALGNPLLIDFETKIELWFLGSILIFIGLAIYYVCCPKRIKKFGDANSQFNAIINLSLIHI